MDTVVEHIVDLTQYAWVFRYPGEPLELSPEAARDALSRADRLVQAVRSRLPIETGA